MSTTSSERFGQILPANKQLLAWVEEVAELTTPDHIFWCDGSGEEKEFLTQQAVDQKILIKLDQEKWPGCYYHHSNPNDVARVEQATFICCERKEDAGPTNNWVAPKEMYDKLHGMLRGSMKGRTMYVIPYLMGPAGSPMTKVGVELTDSIYVVLNMRIMTRIARSPLTYNMQTMIGKRITGTACQDICPVMTTITQGISSC